ncbi:hypothetical protein MYP_1150 [Sporocytophaga myxococcoides]|uniref:Lipoprotein n=1 Tax=Sporocytophaga myxococcoides TaxID=153721 RepID=A0A098LBX1_9BACT|nr:hypothetical protein [Sporocytophaga myxococcoides]GAL83922.1 hypothetical protein MYP_1150 [Sporocytophaga myxococcoides]
MRLIFCLIAVTLFSCTENVSEKSDGNIENDSVRKDSVSLKKISLDSLTRKPDPVLLLIDKINHCVKQMEDLNYSEDEDGSKWTFYKNSLMIDLDQLLHGNLLNTEQLKTLEAVVFSEDQQAGVLNVFENSGGTFQSYTIWMFHKTKDSVYYDILYNELPVGGVYGLGKNRYIITGGGKSCTTCYSDFLKEVEFRQDSFIVNKKFDINYRMGETVTFDYDPLSRLFRYECCPESEMKEDNAECEDICGIQFYYNL